MAAVRHRFQTFEFSTTDIHARTLRDRQQYDDPGGQAESQGVSPASWPLFGVVWASGEVLAHVIDDYDLAGLRILEVGCGIGLASLLANQQCADITASDYHPVADEFLAYNARLNECRAIPFYRSVWGGSPSRCGRFDLVIGSDLLYEPDHPALLAAFIDQHAKASAKVIIIDPGRGNAAVFRRQMGAFGFQHSVSKVDYGERLSQPFRGAIHLFARPSAAG